LTVEAIHKIDKESPEMGDSILAQPSIGNLAFFISNLI